MPNEAAIGFRIKSGWASAVLIGGPADAPRLLDRGRIELSDPGVPETTQPYHEGFGTEQSDAAVVRKLVRIITRCAERSVRELVDRYRASGHRLKGIGVVAGSIIDPASIPNQHIRAHASEGRLFRTVLIDAASTNGLESMVFVEKELAAVAARSLGQSADRLRRRVTELGRSLDGPWRADDKAAALAAWVLLGSRA